ncbi:MAG: DUF6434 domain-containing protein [Pseudomonadota bacterium]
MASRAEFERWYWPVEQLREFCVLLGVKKSGNKAELRERVALAFDGKAASSRKARARGTGDWNPKSLTLETVIPEGVSFGPTFRGFFKQRIGRKFVCHSDFMDWVRSNTGATLGEAVKAWYRLEARKADPGFRRVIAAPNNYLQYLRDVRDANPTLTLEDAKRCWDAKKIRPAKQGRVVYEAADLRYLESRELRLSRHEKR